VEREWPIFVKRYLTAFGSQAERRWAESEDHRNLAIKRSMAVVESPWETELDSVGDTREFIFLRDFFNAFQECTHSCRALDLIGKLSFASIDALDENEQAAAITYWIESYLNEVYIFHLRLLDLTKFIQRKYKKDVDFSEFVMEVGGSLSEFVKGQLAPLIEDRGAHVHARRHRHADPELSRLAILDVLIDVLGREDLRATRVDSRKAAREWLAKQVAYSSDLSWHLLNEVCRGFSEGILLDIDRIIVPLPYKDNPGALLNARNQQST
jgi:hypothetical protein